MKKSSGKVRLVIAALVLANCLPWLVYKLCGSAILWPKERVYSEEQRRDSEELARYEIVFPTSGVIVSGRRHYWTFCFVLPVAQLSLFAIWAAFGGKPLSWRLTYLVACAGLLTRMQLDEPLEASWFAAKQVCLRYLLELGLFVFICLFIARMLGIQIRMPVEGDEDTEDSKERLERFQFSIRYLLWWTVGFAALLAVCQRMFTAEELYWWLWLSANHIAMVVRLATLAPAALWLALGTRWPIVRIIVFCISILIAINPFTATHHVVYRLLYYTIASAWIAGTLWGFRYMGYRLVWRERVAL